MPLVYYELNVCFLIFKKEYWITSYILFVLHMRKKTRDSSRTRHVNIKRKKTQKKSIMLSSIPYENVELNCDENDIQTFVINSLKYKSILKIQQLTDGLSNHLFALRSSDDHGIIVKIYGKNSDLIVDRKAEIDLMIQLAKFHMAPAIVVTFKNGFVYKYVPGTPIQHGDTEKA